MKKIIWLVVLGVVFYAGYSLADTSVEDRVALEKIEAMEMHKTEVEELVRNQAKAWETGDIELLKSTMHEDIVFAYPGRRLNYDQVVEDLEYYKEHFTDTKVYIHNIIVEGDMVGVEWQFASTNDDGKRTSVSDGIIGEIKDGKILSWKEYLDGRVSRMQVVDELPLEEGEEPFPWPVKPVNP